MTGSYHFIVRDSQSLEREITVELADDVVVQVEVSTRGRIRQGNTFWICCAERHLANHVWENDDCPRDDKLRVNRLDPDDLITAIRWRIA